MGLAFVLCVVGVVCAIAWGLVRVRQGIEVGELWYGLVPVGAAAGLVALLVQLGVVVAYAMLGGMPSEMTRAEAAQRADVVLLNTVLLGVLLEGAKYQALQWFDTRVERGHWVLYGAALGIGAGLVQALLKVGPVSWGVVTQQVALEGAQWWLIPQEVALIAMNASLSALVMYEAAKGRAVRGLILGGGLHAIGLACAPVLLWFGSFGGLDSALRMVAYLVVGGIGALWIRSQVRRHGWPF